MRALVAHGKRARDALPELARAALEHERLAGNSAIGGHGRALLSTHRPRPQSPCVTASLAVRVANDVADIDRNRAGLRADHRLRGRREIHHRRAAAAAKSIVLRVDEAAAAGGREGRSTTAAEPAPRIVDASAGAANELGHDPRVGRPRDSFRCSEVGQAASSRRARHLRRFGPDRWRRPARPRRRGSPRRGPGGPGARAGSLPGRRSRRASSRRP